MAHRPRKHRLRRPRDGAPRALLVLAALAFSTALLPAAHAVAHRDATGAASSGATLDLTTPAGVVAGDLLLAHVTVRGGSAATITAPGGWTLVDRVDSGSGLAQAVYRRVATSAEAATHTWTFDATRESAGAMLAYSGVDESAPIDAFAGQANANNTTVLAPSVTTTVPNGFLVGFFGSAVGTTVTPPAGMTEREDLASAGGAGAWNRSTASSADEALGAAGATGTRSATAAASAVNVGHLAALRPLTVAFNASSSSGGESATSVSLGVSLAAAASQAVTVDYAVTGGTATGGGGDYTLAAGTLTIAAGETWDTIDVAVVDDGVDEGDETITVTLSNATWAILGPATAHTYTIQDDDTVGLSVVESGGSSEVTESGAGDSFTVALAAQPTGDVVVNVTSDDVGEATATPGLLTFGTGNWSVAQTVTLAAAEDNLVDGNQTANVTVAVWDADSADEYDAVADQTVAATVVDSGRTSGGGGGGGSAPDSYAGGDVVVEGYLVPPSEGADAAYQASVFYAEPGSLLEVVMADPLLPALVLELDGAIEGGQIDVLRYEEPPADAPLPEGVIVHGAIAFEMQQDGALAEAQFHVVLDDAALTDPRRLLLVQWTGDAWQPIDRVAVTCVGASCEGVAESPREALHAVVEDLSPPRLDVALSGLDLSVATEDEFAAVTVQVLLDGAPVEAVPDASGHLDLASLADEPGDHAVTIRATDAAGNAGEHTASFSVASARAPSQREATDAEDDEGERQGSPSAGALGIAAAAAGAILLSGVRRRRRGPR